MQTWRDWPLWGRWFVAFSALCMGLCGYSVIGILFVQWKVGTFQIWEPVIGTTAYDRWLIELPMFGMFWLAVGWTVLGLVWLLSRRKGEAVVLVPMVWVSWVVIELAMTLMIWEPVSP